MMKMVKCIQKDFIVGKRVNILRGYLIKEYERIKN